MTPIQYTVSMKYNLCVKKSPMSFLAWSLHMPCIIHSDLSCTWRMTPCEKCLKQKQVELCDNMSHQFNWWDSISLEKWEWLKNLLCQIEPIHAILIKLMVNLLHSMWLYYHSRDLEPFWASLSMLDPKTTWTPSILISLAQWIMQLYCMK